ncbi:2-C-methyl-D-erythritol 4-phosphate cytidylyltransferase [Pedobacter sp. P351]|uniref:2-C-methyl-D-erythritol 4-phosphate cytidylyltransferase n=1 Tax=Pedobacter superstes TaxID=3133441 RepID=UPI00309F9C4A
MKYYAIIVAGGFGIRMKSDIPKQFLLLRGKPVLMHTIEAFYTSDLKPEIILVLNSEYFSLWSELKTLHNFTIPVTLANNGLQRFHSVKNALEIIIEDSIIAVHDAVRPIVSNELITRTFKLAEQNAAVIPVVICKDSVRIKDGNNTKALNREDILLVQTPQVFQSRLLKQAYMQDYNSKFTDDASVVEKTGAEIFTTEGDYRNIKITFTEDLTVAEIYLQNKT